MLSLLIRNATIIDGTGKPAVVGDVAVDGPRLVEIGGRVPEPADRVVDAQERVVCPGFIDMHSHVDMSLDDYPRADGMIRQGATTLVTGNCGICPFPSPHDPPAEESSRWRDLRSLASRVQGRLAANIAPLMGHGAIRTAIMADPGGQPTPDERERMAGEVRALMRQGCLGLSTGLIYDPGRFADTAEIIELARVVAEHGGFYASHIRDEGDKLVEAVDEAIAIGAAAGLPVQLSHHKAKRKRNWGTTAQTLAMVDDARTRGLDVLLDCYPYTASSTSLWAYVPHWARASDLLAFGGALPDDLRARLLSGMEERFPGCAAPERPATDLDDLVISRVGGDAAGAVWEGRRLTECAQASRQSTADFAIDLLLAAGNVQIIDHAMSDDDMRRVYAHPACTVGSDAASVHPDMPGIPHPRNFGTFPRFFDVVRGRMPLEQAIHKCTGLPARRLAGAASAAVPPRGVLAPGAAADLLMFDPDRFHDQSTFDDPKRASTGLDLVVVNGDVVVEDDVDTGAASGRMLLRTGGARR